MRLGLYITARYVRNWQHNCLPEFTSHSVLPLAVQVIFVLCNSQSMYLHGHWSMSCPVDTNELVFAARRRVGTSGLNGEGVN
jgi:hypothetical protein